MLSSRFDVKIAAAVAEETKLPFVTAENKFEALVSLQAKCAFLIYFLVQSDISYLVVTLVLFVGSVIW